VAPNIYYLGAAGVVRYRGLRIAGVSGIYKNFDYRKGRFECPPYDNSSLRSVYHVRNVEVARLKVLEHLSNRRRMNSVNNKDNNGNGNGNIGNVVDVMLSHDWPRGIEQSGNTRELIRKKKFFEQEIRENNLGSPSNEELLKSLKPKWWFAGHLHVKFKASYQHRNRNQNQQRQHQRDRRPAQAQDSTSAGEVEAKAKAEEEITSDTQFIALESSSKACTDDMTDLTDLMTQFLSLDKCLPRRHHLSVVNVPVPVPVSVPMSVPDPVPDLAPNPDPVAPIASSTPEAGSEVEAGGDENQPKASSKASSSSSSSSNGVLQYDLEWLAILQKTQHWTRTARANFPDPNPEEINVTDDDLDAIRKALLTKNHHHRHHYTSTHADASDERKMDMNMDMDMNIIDPTAIPLNFSMTIQPHGTIGSNERVNGGRMVGNPQTDSLLEKLKLNHIVTTPYVYTSDSISTIVNACASDNKGCNSLGSGTGNLGAESITENLNQDINEIDLDDIENENDDDGGNETVVNNGDENEIDLDDGDTDDDIIGVKNVVDDGDENEIDLDND